MPSARREAESRVAAMLEGVRASGLKLTPQRMAIVRELAADPTHPTAQELYERLRPSLPTMSFATVYNTLDALASAGLCAAMSLVPGASRFDPNMAAHHHAVCDRCGLVRDVPAGGAQPGAPAPGRARAAGGAPGRAPPGGGGGPPGRARAGGAGGGGGAPAGAGAAGGAPGRATPGGGQDLADVAPGFQVRAVERIYRGLCAECARPQPKKERSRAS